MIRIRTATPLAMMLALALTACEQQAEETGEMEGTADTMSAASAEAQLDSLRIAYENAWNAGDMTAIEGMMTSGYEEVGPEGRLNYDQAVTMMRDSSNMPPPGATLSIDTESMEVSESGDVAYGSGTSTVTVPGPPMLSTPSSRRRGGRGHVRNDALGGRLQARGWRMEGGPARVRAGCRSSDDAFGGRRGHDRSDVAGRRLGRAS